MSLHIEQTFWYNHCDKLCHKSRTQETRFYLLTLLPGYKHKSKHHTGGNSHMSKYRKMKTEYSSRAHLREALKASGVEFEECKPGTEEHLYGYHDKRRAETATFIVRRKHISVSSNDLGWHWNPETRRFEGIVSEYDSGERNTTRIRQTVKREYAASTTIAAARAKGYKVKRVDTDAGGIQLVVTGRVS